MQNNQVKWLIYTVFVGLIPIFLRALISMVAERGDISILTPVDIIAFGFVLHISVINEIEHFKGNDPWKSVFNGVSILFLVLYSAFSGILILSTEDHKLLDTEATLALVSFLAMVSLGIGIAVFFKMFGSVGEGQTHE